MATDSRSFLFKNNTCNQRKKKKHFPSCRLDKVKQLKLVRLESGGHCSNFRCGLKGRVKMLMRIKSSTQSNAYLSGLAVIRRFGGRSKAQSWEVQSAGAPRRKPTITDR